MGIDGFSPGLMYAYVLFGSGLGLLVGGFRRCFGGVVCLRHDGGGQL